MSLGSREKKNRPKKLFFPMHRKRKKKTARTVRLTLLLRSGTTHARICFGVFISKKTPLGNASCTQFIDFMQIPFMPKRRSETPCRIKNNGRRRGKNGQRNGHQNKGNRHIFFFFVLFWNACSHRNKNPRNKQI